MFEANQPLCVRKFINVIPGSIKNAWPWTLRPNVRKQSPFSESGWIEVGSDGHTKNLPTYLEYVEVKRDH